VSVEISQHTVLTWQTLSWSSTERHLYQKCQN